MSGLVVLLAVTTLYAQPLRTGFDGSRRSQYAVPEDDLYKSPIRMAITRDGRSLFVVCENTYEVLVVDTETRRVGNAVSVGRHPFGITLSPDERLLYVGNRWDDNVSVIDLETMDVLRTFPVGDDPHGLVTDVSGDHIYVTNLATDDISIVETEGFTEVKRLTAGKSPFDITRAPDDKYLYISNQLSNPVPFRSPSVLELTVMDAGRRLVEGRRDLVSTVVGQAVAVSPDNRFVVVALELPKNLIPETQIYQGWMVTYGFAIAETGPQGRVAYLLLDEPNLYYADPFGIAFSPDGRHMYVTSSGVDVVSVVDMDRVYRLLDVRDGKIGISDETIAQYARHLAISTEYVVARIPTESNPKGLVFSPDGRWVYVANRLSDTITLIDARRHEAVDIIDLGGPKVETLLRKGEKLFNYASISFQKQLSCNTCHPENHLDGLIYDIAIDGGMGRNLVDNRTMRGIADTAPFKWSGKNPTLFRQEGPRAAQLFFRSHGFEKDDNEAIVRFLESRRLPDNRYLDAGGNLTEFQKRGRDLFQRAYTNDGRYIPASNRCITCHPPPYYTDRMKHDVGSQAYFDTENEFDTPHLSNIYENAPFMHDGRCFSLEEIWTEFNPDDLHGATNDMKKEQLNDLIEYMKASPPYEPPEVSQAPSIVFQEDARELEIGDMDTLETPGAGYVGNLVCKSCHEEAYRIWVASGHARAYVVLQTMMSMTMGEEGGIEASSPQKSAQCLSCHATAATVSSGYRAAGFRIEEGVKCEACHGPGQHYIKDCRSAAEAGEMLFLKEKDCMVCHEPKPSHEKLKTKPFDYTVSWRKIVHPLDKKEKGDHEEKSGM